MSSACKPEIPASRGFTLVEVLVALILSLLVVGLVAHALYQGLRTRERVEAQRTGLADWNALTRTLRRRIGDALPLLPGEEATWLRLASWDRHRLEVVTPVARAGGVVLQRYRFRIRTGTEGSRLELVWEPLTGPAAGTVHREALYRCPCWMAFDYLLVEPDTERHRWRSVWKGSAYPVLVRLRFRDPATDRPGYLPDLVVATAYPRFR